MTKNIDSKKVELIEKIAAINSEEELDRLAQYLRLSMLKGKHGNIFGNTKKSINLADLKAEQNHKKFDREKFDKLVSDLDVQETIDELLAMLD